MKTNSNRIALWFLFSAITVIAGVIILDIDFESLRPRPKDIKQSTRPWRVPFPKPILSINPQRVIDTSEKGLLSTVYSRLIKIDSDFNVQSDIAERWTHDLISKKYVIHLRRGIKFHNKKPMTADDVLFSFHYWAKKDSLDSNLLLSITGVNAYQNGTANYITGLRKLDNFTIEISLDTWSDRFILDLAMPRFCIYADNFDGKLPEQYFQKPNATGPFQVNTLKDGTLRLTRNNQYYFGLPNTSEIEVFYLPDERALSAFNSGEIDNLVFFQIEGNRHIENFPDLIDQATKSYKTLALIINPKADARLKNARLRAIIAELIPKDDLLKTCYPGAKAADSLIPIGVAGSEVTQGNEKLKTSKIDLSGLPKNLTIYIEKNLSSPCVINILNQKFARFHIKAIEKTFGEMFDDFKSEKLALWIELLEFKNEDPFSVLQYFWDASSEYLIGIKLPELSDLYGRVLKSKTYGEKSMLCREIDTFLTKNSYTIPIGHLTSRIVHRGWVKGISITGNRDYLNDWHNIVIEETGI